MSNMTIDSSYLPNWEAGLSGAAAAGTVVDAGVWDASTGVFPGGGTATKGSVYQCSVSGTVNAVVFDAGDTVRALVTNASTTTYVGNWLKGQGVVTSTDISDSTAAGRALLVAASVAAQKTALAIAYADVSGLGSAAQQASSAFDAAGAASTAQAFAIQRANHAGSQPSSTLSDSTTAGRALLTATNVTAQMSLLGTVPFLSSLAIAGALSQGAFAYGTLPYTDTNIFESFKTSVNSYVQSILHNSNGGAAASSDFVVGNDLGTATTFYGNFGINSSGFTGTGSLALASATYVTATSGDLVFGTTTSNALHFLANNAATDAITISTANIATLNSPVLLTPTLGIVGSAVGALAFANATSGTITVKPTTGALGSSVLTLPAVTDTVAVLGTAQTFSAVNTFSAASLVSAPAFKFTGALFSGGTQTTTRPHILIEPTGTTASTHYSTGGTFIGVNAATGFSGNFLDFSVNGGFSLAAINSAGQFVGNAVYINSAVGFANSAGPIFQPTVIGLGSTNTFGWSAGTGGQSPTLDVILTRGGVATLQLGALDAAAPVAQTLQVQSVVAGTTNTAGTNWTINGSKGTGTGAGGDVVFQTAKASTTGTTQNTLAEAFRIMGTGAVVKVSGGGVTFANLPAAVQGGLAFITDALMAAGLSIGSTAAGGGSTKRLVYSDGSNWIYV